MKPKNTFCFGFRTPSARLFNSFLLYDIKQIRIDLGTYRGHFGTLTPFHHACMAQRVDKPLPEPSVLPAPESLRDDGLTSLGFTAMPVRADGTVLSLGCTGKRSFKHFQTVGPCATLAFVQSKHLFTKNGETMGGMKRVSPGEELGVTHSGELEHL